MKCRGSFSEIVKVEVGRRVCVTLETVATCFKRWKPPKDPLVFMNTIPTSTSNTPLKRSTRLKK